MAIKFSCSGCGAKLQAPENLAGSRMPCPKCKTALEIPAPSPPDDLTPFELAPIEEAKAAAPATPQHAATTLPPAPAPQPVPAATSSELLKHPIVLAGLAVIVLLAGTLLFVLGRASAPVASLPIDTPSSVPPPAIEPKPAPHVQQNVPAAKPTSMSSAARPSPIHRASPPSTSTSTRSTPPAAPALPFDPNRHETLLPGTISDVVPAKGGKLLLIVMKDSRSLAVFDIEQEKIVTTIPLSSDDVRVAACMNKFVAVAVRQGVLERWSLDTFSREKMQPFAVDGEIQAVAMGCASQGPLAILSKSISDASRPKAALTFFDLDSLNETDVTGTELLNKRNGLSSPIGLRVASNGKFFALWSSHSTNLFALHMFGTHADVYNSTANSVYYLAPNADGTAVLSDRSGYYSPRMKPLSASSSQSGSMVPTSLPRLYALIPPNYGMNSRNSPTLTATVHSLGNPTPLVTLPDLCLQRQNSGTIIPITLDKRIFCRFDQKKLVSIPLTNDRVVVQPFDLATALGKGGRNYLAVSSMPPDSFAVGDTVEYPITVLSNSPEITYELLSSPEGMTVSPQGVVRWTVPDDFSSETVDVVVAVKNAANEMTYEKFTLNNLSAPGTNEQRQSAQSLARLLADPNRKEIKLPDTIVDAQLAQGGRLLLFQFKTANKIAAFDIERGEFVGEIPLRSDDALIAGGLNSVVIASPLNGVIERWSLDSFKNELVRPFKGKIKNIAMGYASDGPLLVFFDPGERPRTGPWPKPLSFLALKTLESIKIELPQLNVSGSDEVCIRASGRGDAFAFWKLGVGPSGINLLTLRSDKAEFIRAHESGGHVVPNFDGSAVLTGTNGILNSKMNHQSNKKDSLDVPVHFVPSSAPQICVSFPVHVKDASNPSKEVLTAAICTITDGRRLLPLPDLELGVTDEESFRRPGILTIDKRVIYIPGLDRLISLPFSNDRMIVRTLDLKKSLAERETDYFFVLSTPPATVDADQMFRYPIEVVSNIENVSFELSSGPPGMTVSRQGVVEWQMPSSFGQRWADVIVTVRNKTGQAIFETFSIDTGTSQTPGPKNSAPSLARAIPAQPPSSDATAESSEPRQELILPDAILDVQLAKGGKLLLIQFKNTRSIAVFDIESAKIVRYIAVSADDALIAGCIDAMFIASPEMNTIERWSLDTFERELARPLPVTGQLKNIAIGYASTGPLLIHSADADGGSLGKAFYTFHDPKSFSETKIVMDRLNNSINRDQFQIRAAATGDIFGLWATSGSPTGVETVVLRGDRGLVTYLHDSWGHVLPSFDGSFILTGSGRILSPQLQTLYDVDKSRTTMLPSTLSRLCVSFSLEREPGSSPYDPIPKPIIRTLPDGAKLVVLPNLELGKLPDNRGPDSLRFSIDKRVVLSPQSKRLISFPFSDDRMIIHKLDLHESLEKAGKDYLFVTSTSERFFVEGKPYQYQIDVMSKADGLEFELNTGPEGMTVSPKGLVQWNVPKDFAEREVSVIVTIRNKAGLSRFETFTISTQRPPLPGTPRANPLKPNSTKPKALQT